MIQFGSLNQFIDSRKANVDVTKHM